MLKHKVFTKESTCIHCLQESFIGRNQNFLDASCHCCSQISGESNIFGCCATNETRLVCMHEDKCRLCMPSGVRCNNCWEIHCSPVWSQTRSSPVCQGDNQGFAIAQCGQWDGSWGPTSYMWGHISSELFQSLVQRESHEYQEWWLIYLCCKTWCL